MRQAGCRWNRLRGDIMHVCLLFASTRSITVTVRDRAAIQEIALHAIVVIRYHEVSIVRREGERCRFSMRRHRNRRAQSVVGGRHHIDTATGEICDVELPALAVQRQIGGVAANGHHGSKGGSGRLEAE